MEAMRALTVRQPWASLIVEGVKDVENREWSVGYRGPIVIHSSLAVTSADEWLQAYRIALSVGYDVEEPLGPEAFATYRHGAILGVVDLVDIVMGHDPPWSAPSGFQWLLRSPRRFAEPIDWRGRQGLWELPDDVAAAHLHGV